MPNISLAAHHVFTPDLSEAALRAACTARLGMPLTGQMLPGTLPFYPSLPAIDSEHEETPLDTISELQVSLLDMSGNYQSTEHCLAWLLSFHHVSCNHHYNCCNVI